MTRVIYKEKGKLVAFFSVDIDDTSSTSAPTELMELQERLDSEVRKYCVSYLTSAMVPSRCRLVWPTFPVTENGKVTFFFHYLCSGSSSHICYPQLDIGSLLHSAKLKQPGTTFYIVRRPNNADEETIGGLTDEARVHSAVTMEWHRLLNDINPEAKNISTGYSWKDILFYSITPDSMAAQSFIERILTTLGRTRFYPYFPFLIFLII